MKLHYTIYLISLALCAALFNTALAQDQAHSLYEELGAYYNPALSTGNSLQITANHRSQWGQGLAPYQGTTLAANLESKNIGISLLCFKEGAGPSTLSHQQFAFGANYLFKLSERHEIRPGLQLGLLNKSFDPNQLQFDDQYQAGVGYNPDLQTGQSFAFTQLSALDLGAGLSYTYRADPEAFIQNAGVGFGAIHLNQPQMSFTESGAKVPARYTAQASAAFRASSQLQVRPAILYMKQGTASSLLTQASARYQSAQMLSITGGLGYRWGDAVVAKVGMGTEALQIHFAYDLATTPLRGYQKGLNSWELGLSYRIARFKPGVKKPKLPKLFKNKKEKPKTVVSNDLIDTDKDGLIDSKDNCPLVPGPVYLIGCPETDIDIDKDGIPNKIDKCPGVAGLASLEGCPQPVKASPEINNPNMDADKDGVPNLTDVCPYVPGLVQLDGCPDTDGDQISDLEDPCPLIYGPKWNKGCPREEQISLHRPALTQEMLQFGPITFDTDKSIVKPVYQQLLDNLAQYMLSRETHQLLLNGHTDGDGDTQYNQQLAQSRAEAVMLYLIKKGISPARMKVLSFGETLPTASNQTNTGKALNRRVELILVPGSR